MEDEELAFRKEICEHPEDDLLRLVYADWLDERAQPGDGERAEFIRAQCEAARLPEGDPRRRALENRADRLLSGQRQRWMQELKDQGLEFLRIEFERGSPCHATLDAGLYLTRADDIFAAAPIRSLYFNRVTSEQVEAVTASPQLGRLEGLALGGPAVERSVGDAAVQGLAASPHLSRLRRLNLSQANVGPEGARALASSRHLSGLEDLNLSFNHLGDAGAELLATAPYLSRLRNLGLRNNGISQGAQALASAPRAYALLKCCQAQMLRFLSRPITGYSAGTPAPNPFPGHYLSSAYALLPPPGWLPSGNWT